MNIRSVSVSIVSSALAALSLTGCVVAPYPPPRHAVEVAPGYPPPRPMQGVIVAEPGAETYVAPPARPVEMIPPPPFRGAVWIDGYWSWNGDMHYWTPGHYERARAGYRWVPYRWVQRRDGGWARIGGWVR